MQDNTFPHYETGTPDGKLLVFLAGFPDDTTSGWGDSIEQLRKTGKFRMIFLCLPGYHSSNPPKSWGHNFDELIIMLDRTVNNLIGEKAKFDFVVHDWGSIIGLLYQNKHPDRIGKFITLGILYFAMNLLI